MIIATVCPTCRTRQPTRFVTTANVDGAPRQIVECPACGVSSALPALPTTGPGRLSAAPA